MPTLCIHCLAAPAGEKDHVLPRSWYPDGTPPTVQRLTVPSCQACGARLKKAEEQMALALTFARGFDKDHDAALGVHDRVRATWDVTAAGASARGRKYRRDRAHSIMSRVRPVVAAPAEMVGAARIPARTAAGVWVEAAVALKFRREDFDAVIGKFVRGLHYHRTGTPLSADAKITAFDPSPEMMRVVAQLPDQGALSEGLLWRFYQDEQPGRSWWFFLLWGQVSMAALVEMLGADALGTG